MGDDTTSTEKDHTYFEDLLPGYALGSLEAGEDFQLAEHLGDCPDCRTELVAYRNIVMELPQAMVEVDPPPELKEKIIARARGAGSNDPRESNLPLWQSTKTIFHRLPSLAVASLLLIIVLGLSNLALLARQAQTSIADRSNLQRIYLTGTEYSPDATGLFVISREGEYGTLIVDDLPELDSYQQYQLWLIRNGERSSGGVFSVGDDGYGSLVVASDQALVLYDSFGITIEPTGGSPEPSGDKVLGGQL